MDLLIEYVLPTIILTLLPIGLYALRLRPKLEQEDIPALLFFILSLGLLCVVMPSVLSVAVMIPWLWYGLLIIPQLVHWAVWILSAVKKKPSGVWILLSPCLPLLACAAVISSVALIPIVAYALRIILAHRK